MSRYYDNKEGSEDQIKPGKISNELRQALGMAENDVPIWIYRMRALGYPPGWLSKAVVDTNDIFDTDTAGPQSVKRKNPPIDEIQYDHSKLIDYPGFNSPMPPNTVDYHYYYNMPPMLPHQQLEYAKKHMNAFTPAPVPKRVRADLNESASSSTSAGYGPSSGNPSNPQNGTKSGDEHECAEGPASPDVNDELSGKQLSVKNGDESLLSPASGDNIEDTTANRSSLSVSLIEEVKLVSEGSPMPKQVERLPLERFSEGVVGDLLYFENIPNSTGKFDSIRGLLNNMRKASKGGLSDTSFESTTTNNK